MLCQRIFNYVRHVSITTFLKKCVRYMLTLLIRLRHFILNSYLCHDSLCLSNRIWTTDCCLLILLMRHSLFYSYFWCDCLYFTYTSGATVFISLILLVRQSTVYSYFWCDSHYFTKVMLLVQQSSLYSYVSCDRLFFSHSSAKFWFWYDTRCMNYFWGTTLATLLIL